MALDPSTPVIVGVGQVTNRPDPEGAGSLADRPEPIGLMVGCRAGGRRGLRRRGARRGGPGRTLAPQPHPVAAGGQPAELALREPRAAVAEALGHRAGPADGDHHRGQQPPEHGQRHRPGHRPGRAGRGRAGRGGLRLHPGGHPAAPRPAPPALDGAAGRHPPARPCSGTTAGAPPTPRRSGDSTCPSTSSRCSRTPSGPRPVDRSDDHRHRIGALWSRFSEVAAANPYAWLPTRPGRRRRSPRSSETNRMIAYPYTKLLTANMQVDQGAALILCSVAAARAAGVPEDRWVFPLAGADADDHWFLSHRLDFHSSPAIRLAGSSALALAGHRRRGARTGGPLLLLPLGGADRRRRAGPARRRSGPAADRDRRPDLRRRPGQQLRHPRRGLHGARPPVRAGARRAWSPGSAGT